MEEKSTKYKKSENPQEKEAQLRCGIVMPIAHHPDYPLNHWNDVLAIIKEAIEETEFKSSLVSEALDIGLIHERIVNNLYSNEMVVCDVSSKNPNVMFELGLRLAFDKPTIIIKDDKTNYSFDIGGIEHLTYPSTLRFSEITNFKSDLTRRIIATYEVAKSNKEYSPFLKKYGNEIVPGKLVGKEISENEYIMDSLEDLTRKMNFLSSSLSDNYIFGKDSNFSQNSREKAPKLIRDEIRGHVMTNGSPYNSNDEIMSTLKYLKNELGINISFQALKNEILNMGFWKPNIKE